jgi:hypothetical protein
MAHLTVFFIFLMPMQNRMKPLITIAAIIILSSCNRKEGLDWFSAEKAGEYFKSVEEICNKDNGSLWGENLYGPVMFVDNLSREIYANVADSNGILKAREGIFTGVLPKERLITNNVIEFGGVRYAMVPLPDTEDRYRITARSVHSLFHCYQERHDLKPSTFNTRHLNDKNSRFYLKLEWKALISAIGATGELRRQAIRDALIFRGARRELFPEALTDENKFENYEGLTTFTYVKLCTEDNDEMRARILEYLDRIYSNSSYASGYGFVHGALYATLLNDMGFDFKQIKQADFDLGKATREAYGVTLPEVCRDIAGSLAMNYDVQAIRTEESEREAMINERTGKIVTTFFEKPVVTVTMESPNFSYEPEDINFLDSLGTLYERLRVSDNWGRLTVDDGGALLANDLRTLRISARVMEIDRNHISGAGWHLILNDGWQAVTGEDGSYAVIKQ